MKLAIEKTDPALQAELAGYFASQRRRQNVAPHEDERQVARGEKIAEQGIPLAKVPPCLKCHDGRGRNRTYPLLFGQRSAYLESQLRLFASGVRGGTPYSHLMTRVAKGLGPEDIESAAAYFAARSPNPPD